MSDTAKLTRLSINPNLLGLVVAVVTIIGANLATTSMMSNSLRSEMDARFDAVDQRFDGIDQRFDGIDDRLDRIDDRLERMDGQLYDMNDRLARVESGVFGYEPPTPLESPSEDESSPLSDTTPAPDSVADL